MTYSPNLGSNFNDTFNRSKKISPQSGMCSLCTESCNGTCEIALASVLGMQTVYPTTTGANQIASEKDYPIDYSHFNINGRVFGAQGVKENSDEATVFNVNTEVEYGFENKVKMTMPVILPALIKMNWRDYFAGAAMAGVTCMIGEDARAKDPDLKIESGKIIDFPFLGEILESFNSYYRGYGQIVLQCNTDDDLMGVPDIGILKYGVKAVELKFGQGAKGTQPVTRLKGIKQALELKKKGSKVYPDPEDPKMINAQQEGVCPNFYTYGRFPFWEKKYLFRRMEAFKNMGCENFYFKMAGYDVADIEKVLWLASELKIDMVTFDGAGGGSGYSPCKMMNEWAYPTVCMEEAILKIAKQMEEEGCYLPAIVITGGFASEDTVFKALSYGNKKVTAIGLCRASMSAAMTGKSIGDQIKAGHVPNSFKQYGETIEEIFGDLADLRSIYGRKANTFSTGAIGVFSYLQKINFGVKHFAALNRKFDLSYLNQTDLIPLTRDAKDLISGKWFEVEENQEVKSK